jgi:NADH-quinone oxidoreductase subunit E
MDIPHELSEKIDEAVSHYPVSKRSATLPVLHLLQQHFGYITGESIDWTAQRLGIEPINVYELVTLPGFPSDCPAVGTSASRTLFARWRAAMNSRTASASSAASTAAMGHGHLAVSADGASASSLPNAWQVGTAPVARQRRLPREGQTRPR